MGAVSVGCENGELVLHIEDVPNYTHTTDGELAAGHTVTVTFYGPWADQSIGVVNTTVIDIPADLDCTPDTTSTQAAPTTSEATTGTTAPTTTLPVSSSVPSTQPATTRALDLDTVPATVAEIGHARELPATGAGIEGPIAAGLATIIGLALLTVRRRPAC